LFNKYQEQVGHGFSDTPKQAYTIPINGLLAKSIYKITFMCLNLMEVANSDFLVFTTKNNEGQIARLDINFNKVSE